MASFGETQVKAEPELDYVNNLYLYPDMLNFTNYPQGHPSCPPVLPA